MGPRKLALRTFITEENEGALIDPITGAVVLCYTVILYHTILHYA